MNNSKVEIYLVEEGKSEINVRIEGETIWLSQKQMSELFEKDTDTIGLHIRKIFQTGELIEKATTEEYSVVQIEGKRLINRKVKQYNLDVIISVGYRVNSKRGTQFRQWATQRLRDYLIMGYAINEKQLKQKKIEVEYLKTGIRILNRAIEQQATEEDSSTLRVFSKGLSLLDAFDHQTLDTKGLTYVETIYPEFDEYSQLIASMDSLYRSDVFAKPKDESFNSSFNQIRQCFDGKELYPSMEEKAANLLYFITKNHSFVDGNKRIAAACFLFFLEKNDALYNTNGQEIISNEALASLTLFIASSRTEESEIVKHLVISILNQNKS